MQSMYMLHVVSGAMDCIRILQVEHLAPVPCCAGAVYMEGSMSNARGCDGKRDKSGICAKTMHLHWVASADQHVQLVLPDQHLLTTQT